MAVDSTPERSFSLLFRSSRAALATTGCDACLSEMWRRHHRPQRGLDRPPGIGKEVGDARQGLVRLGVQHMKDGADQQRVAGLLPMIALLERALGIDQHIGDVLHVADLPLAATHFEKRIVGGALCVGRIEQQHASEPGAPTCGQRPVLALDVMHDGRSGPDEESWNDQSDALAASRRRESIGHAPDRHGASSHGAIGRGSLRRRAGGRFARISRVSAHRADP